MNMIFEKALITLCETLNNYDITFVVEETFDGYVVRFDENRDVAICTGTHGCELGLWESYGFEEDEGDVTGYLTSGQILCRLLSSEV